MRLIASSRDPNHICRSSTAGHRRGAARRAASSRVESSLGESSERPRHERDFPLPLNFSFLQALLSPASSASTRSCAKTLIARPDRKGPLSGPLSSCSPHHITGRPLPSSLPAGTSLIVAGRGERVTTKGTKKSPADCFTSDRRGNSCARGKDGDVGR